LIGVVGLGNWGTALAEHLARQGYPVRAWDRDAEVVRGIQESGRNPKYQSHVQLSPALQATEKISELWSAEVLLIVIPSAALADFVCTLQADTNVIAARFIVSAVKGFEPQSLKTPIQYFRESTAFSGAYAVLSGPSFAADIILQKPCGLVAAAEDAEAARYIAELFSSESMRVYTSTDITGVELGGILKNVIAIAVGISDGLELGDSARAGLVTRGLAEMVRLAETLGAKKETLFGLSGLGDLVMTATCDTSRNRTVGLRLGRGEDLNAIIQSLGSVAEGVKTAPVLLKVAREKGIELPICEHVFKILDGSSTSQEVIQSLFSRPVKQEY
jgi:glycerol-3-phosphate dehydrogenase (NAD(P)+)